MKLSTPKGNLRNLPHKSTFLRTRFFVKPRKKKAARAPRVGDDIIVTAYGQRGTLTSQAKNGNWEAQVGLIKMSLKADEFTLVRAQAEAQQPKKNKLMWLKKPRRHLLMGLVPV